LRRFAGTRINARFGRILRVEATTAYLPTLPFRNRCFQRQVYVDSRRPQSSQMRKKLSFLNGVAEGEHGFYLVAQRPPG